MMRFDEPSEKIDDFYAHSGSCNYCDGVVKMERCQVSGLIVPRKCWCLKCGQRYFYTDEKLSKKELIELDQRFWKEKVQKNGE